MRSKPLARASIVAMLPPTSSRLSDPTAVPYFLWDLGMTVAAAHQALATGSERERDEIIVRLLREANSRDVWLFIGWKDIQTAWPRIERRLGRARPVWTMMLERHRERADAPDHQTA